MNNETIEHIAAVGDRARDAGAGLGFFGWLLSSQFIGLAGLAVALIGALIGWHYKREAHRRHIAEHKLRVAEHELRMNLLRNGRFVLPWVRDSEKGWFCSEAIAAALGWAEPWRFGPNGLAALLPRLFC